MKIEKLIKEETMGDVEKSSQKETEPNDKNPNSSDANEDTSSYDNSNGKKEDTRSKIAVGYIIGFFIIIASCFLYAGIFKFIVDDLKDLILATSGVLSGPLGFVIGYYFKNGDGEK